jgi:diguanylate cyclase (GGDEF)-like protein/PAS domain S-box-containing protein
VDGLRKLGDLDSLQDVYRALVEQLPAIVYIDDLDDDLTTLYVSPQIRELLGVEPAHYCADPMIWNALLHDEDEERALEEYLRGRDTGEDFAFEYRMVGRNGRLVWFRDSVHVVKDARGDALLLQGVMLDITERKQAEEQVAFLAYHDKLTGLPNRALFGELLDLSLARARRHDLAVGVLYLDVDNFKLVNDSLGHTAGDDLLVQLADRLRGCTRETDLVARQGGDEFLLLLSDLERGTGALSGAADAPMLVAESVASRVQEALDAPFELNGQLHYVTVSSGISLFPQDAQSAEDLLKNADTAMYQSKRAAPGGYVIFSPSGEDPAARLSLATRLRRAVEEKSWVLHYQPLVRLDDGVITGAEALIRWQDANGGIIPPGEFIPVAEEMGLIGAIGDWVIEELAAQHRRARRGDRARGQFQPLAAAAVAVGPGRSDPRAIEPGRGGASRRPRRGHGVHGDGRPRPHDARAQRAPSQGPPPGDRRLRDRVLVPVAAEAHAGGRLEDRSLVRAGGRPRPRRRRHGPGDDPAGAQP